MTDLKGICRYKPISYRCLAYLTNASLCARCFAGKLEHFGKNVYRFKILSYHDMKDILYFIFLLLSTLYLALQFPNSEMHANVALK